MHEWNPLLANGTELNKWYFNFSYLWIFNSKTCAAQLVPDVFLFVHGRTTLPSLVETWFTQEYKNYCHGQLEIPDGLNLAVYPKW